MPEEKVAPRRTPMLATHMVVRNDEMRQPRAELREVDGVVADAYEQIKAGQHGQKAEHDQIEILHLSTQEREFDRYGFSGAEVWPPFMTV